ncbi:MAG: hypothetical protein ACD_78C00223G0001 [uncultured bacterium (gcode 4)]|uniref:Uncharacterized protein n=1 Tax=uncultured bacterium (gcode 4) TaxID=1234023 RepID=K1YX19_9BACT|nr:MAG: hypothetical protein ACD_78C00223G0001 [uncultured bacterium (gcode 4)]
MPIYLKLTRYIHRSIFHEIEDIGRVCLIFGIDIVFDTYFYLGIRTQNQNNRPHGRVSRNLWKIQMIVTGFVDEKQKFSRFSRGYLFRLFRVFFEDLIIKIWHNEFFKYKLISFCSRMVVVIILVVGT